MTTLLLVHGGLWEAGMDADRFWDQPGIVAGLEKRGFDVLAPSRQHQAPDWAAEASHLASALPGRYRDTVIHHEARIYRSIRRTSPPDVKLVVCVTVVTLENCGRRALSTGILVACTSSWKHRD